MSWLLFYSEYHVSLKTIIELFSNRLLPAEVIRQISYGNTISLMIILNCISMHKGRGHRYIFHLRP